ncbi:MAG: hypothetical protein ACTSQO_10170 [Candidatus Helarchaeota archaeon]
MSGLHSFGEIPDDSRTKYYLPLSRNVYKIFRKFGLEYMKSFQGKFRQVQYDITADRWKNMIFTGKKILSGEMSQEEAKKSVLYTVPHIISVRSDLQVGTNKLMYGDSTDVSFAIIDDFSSEILFVFNGHMESGVPSDWYLAGLDDELLDRRHMKYGWKIRDIPAKVKNLSKSAHVLMDVLMDIRNERRPEWKNSRYWVCMAWSSAMYNMFSELSNYEMLGNIYDGLNTKFKYKLPDYYFLYYPIPPLFSSIVYMPRPKFQTVLAGLTSSHKLITSTIEDRALEWVKSDLPEIYDLIYLSQWKEGIPIPAISLNTKIPDHYKKLLDKDDNIIRKEPNGSKCTLENLGISEEEAFEGYILDIDHETPLDVKITPDHKIASGMGHKTKFFK